MINATGQKQGVINKAATKNLESISKRYWKVPVLGLFQANDTKNMVTAM